jgi:hypothetical protein
MWWDVLPDDERLVWDLHPFEIVGPLSYGMAPGEVAAAMSRLTDEQQRCFPHPGFKEGRYRQFGLKLYYRDESMAGVAVDALRGPQVLVEGVALVGRVPSALEQWLTGRAEAYEPYTELLYMDLGVPGSESLGVVIDVQLDDLSHWLPPQAWSRY